MTTEASSAWETLRFQSFSSATEVSFWQKLASLKLNKFKLNDEPLVIDGYYEPGRSADVPARLVVDESSFGAENSSLSDRARYEWKAFGMLLNTNTLEEFKRFDKVGVLTKMKQQLLDAILERKQEPSLDFLNPFVLLTFADLKKHTFVYWFAFPALSPVKPFHATSPVAGSSVFTQSQQVMIARQLLTQNGGSGTDGDANTDVPPFFVIRRSKQTQDVHVYTLVAWRKQYCSSADVEFVFGFVDPSSLPNHPGWPLRNYLAFICHVLSSSPNSPKTIPILCFREQFRHFQHLPDDFAWKSSIFFQVQVPSGGMDLISHESEWQMLGWEPNARGKMGPRAIDLSSLLDPIRLAEASVDLNLKLMRWRQLPELNLELIAKTKCLILGAGTLGCYMARGLLSWGFREITLVDNSTVSHSNPVRQPLYQFVDVGKPKAQCAADNLKKIYPLVNARGVHLSIPMAGHALSNDQLIDEARKGLTTLEELIDEHDVVVLGTDSRESRWLPTVMCACKEKILINVALGFDSFVVMRHGVDHGADDGVSTSHQRLGCYFCNDVVSPRDSLTDRTLDQMCTVTRPGLAPMASAMAIELLVALLHSPHGKYAGASLDSVANTAAPLAFIPHQLRGFLNKFELLHITGQAFDQCVACSHKVQQEFTARGFEFLVQACNESKYLEELTGLHKLTQQAEELMFDVEDSEDEGDLI